MNLTAIGGRRFLLAFVSMILTFILTWCAKISGDVYSVVTIATVGALIAGNTTQHVTSIKTSSSSPAVSK